MYHRKPNRHFTGMFFGDVKDLQINDRIDFKLGEHAVDGIILDKNYKNEKIEFVIGFGDGNEITIPDDKLIVSFVNSEIIEY